jgi:hypothetical protein
MQFRTRRGDSTFASRLIEFHIYMPGRLIRNDANALLASMKRLNIKKARPGLVVPQMSVRDG